MRNFSALHPVSLLVYFLCVISIGMFVGNPVFYILSLAGALCYYALLGRQQFRRDLRFYLIAFLLIALANPLFSHNGRTEMFFLNGRPVTMEATIYGFAVAAMITATIYWFKSFNILMTSDKLLYLFGRAMPQLSVVLSSALRYIPLFRRQTKKIKQSQIAMGLYSDENYIDNAKGTMRVFSVMISWSLENAIDSADSMRARGYGLKGRTQFSIFCFRAPDVLLIAASILLSAVTVAGIAAGAADFTYYPKLSALPVTPRSIIVYASYGLLAFYPCLCEVKENLRWNCCKSKI